MTAAGSIQNQALYDAVQRIRTSFTDAVVREGSDPNSPEFLSRFPFAILIDDTDPEVRRWREQLIEIGFDAGCKEIIEKTIAICYANHGGGTTETYFVDLIQDFLDFALPRTLGLPDADAVFDDYYRQLERDLFGPTLTVTIQAVLGNISHSSGRFPPTAGVHLQHIWFPIPQMALNARYLRQKAVPAIEIRKAARPIAYGRSLEQETGFFILEFVEQLPKERATLNYVYQRSEEITSKVVLALRLLTSADAFSDHRGFRMLGHQSAFNMNLMNWPDDYLARGDHGDLSHSEPALRKLLPALIDKPAGSLAVVDHRLGDALRRWRPAIANEDARRKAEIDKLFDYVQALESLLPLRGSDAIRLAAAILISRSTRASANELDQFFKLIYQIRDDVMHGRLDKVLEDDRKGKRLIDTRRLKHCIHQLAILAILNDNLGFLARQLALGENVNLKTLF
jgi:hypothetical protein